LGDFWENPEISDYTDYETITQITNALNNREKSVKSFFEICVIRDFCPFSGNLIERNLTL